MIWRIGVNVYNKYFTGLLAFGCEEALEENEKHCPPKINLLNGYLKKNNTLGFLFIFQTQAITLLFSFFF